ncbi:CRISPR-associated protein (TIGR03984 family) [Paenibacillus sp. RC254]|uniref:type III-D CRISPR-associated protein Csx19 n=1 Tax=unclassified Paenibacillus TaxID=185978 RepID=UPI0024BB332F|nr:MULTISPECIES: CRISPR-associated protein Csx19 [unclassified Paenibacillus]
MSTLTIMEQRTFVSYKTVEESNLLELLKQWFVMPSDTSETYVYGVMNDQVAIGRYYNQQLWMGHAQSWDVKELKSIEDVKQLRELRIFNVDQELRALRVGQQFRLRLLQDNHSHASASDDQDDQVNLSDQVELSGDFEQSGPRIWSSLDEKHKLWGSADVSKSKLNDIQEHKWTPLVAARGTRLYFPGELKQGAQKAVQIRNYIDFNPVANKLGAYTPIYRFVDERFVDFVDCD